jgi:hypothetical protein
MKSVPSSFVPLRVKVSVATVSREWRITKVPLSEMVWPTPEVGTSISAKASEASRVILMREVRVVGTGE